MDALVNQYFKTHIGNHYMPCLLFSYSKFINFVLCCWNLLFEYFVANTDEIL